MARKTVFLKRDSPMIDLIIAQGRPCIFEVTASTLVIKPKGSDTKYICTDQRMTFKELDFLRRIKESMSDFVGPIPETKKIRYNGFNSTKLMQSKFPIVGGVTEIDLSGAYWEEANRKGYLQESIYLDGLKLAKRKRLELFGAVASVKDIYESDGQGDPVKIGTRTNPKTRAMFRDVAASVGETMQEAQRFIGGEYLFFWVDALFVPVASARGVIDYLSWSGHKFKVRDIYALDFEREKSRVVAYDTRQQWEMRHDPPSWMDPPRPFMSRRIWPKRPPRKSN